MSNAAHVSVLFLGMNYQRIILTVLLAFAIVVASMIWHVSQLQSKLIQTTALRTTELYSIALTQFRTLYTSEVVNRASKHGLEATHDYASRAGAIPLPATLSMMLGENIGKHTAGASSHLYSPYPFPWREKEEKASLNEFDNKAWEFLSANPDKQYYEFSQQDNKSVLRYATADVMRPECVACHNNHPDSPKTDWNVGDVRGVLEVSLPLDNISSETNADLRTTIIAYVTIGLGMVVIITIVIIRLGRQSKDLENQVEERTKDLQSEITERMKMEERFRLGIEASPAAMIMVDEGGVISHINHEAETLFKFSSGELIGQTIEALVPFNERSVHPSYRDSYLVNPEVRRMGGLDLLAQNSQGEVFPVEVRLNPIETADGKVVLCSIVDLTERKQFEKTIIDQSEQLEEANKLLSEQAATDSLTGIGNLRSLFSQLEISLNLSRRYGRYVSILLADIDYFKNYNDDFGHPAGDIALKTVAQTLKDTSRDSDFLARYGGEEFFVLLPETDQDGALTTGEKFRESIETISGLERKITISMGAATVFVDSDTSSNMTRIRDELLEQADKALYFAKAGGRNKVIHFNQPDPFD